MAFDFFLQEWQAQVKFIGLPKEIADNLALSVIRAKESETVPCLLQLEIVVFDVLLDFVKEGNPGAIKRITIEYVRANGSGALLTQTFDVDYISSRLSGVDFQANKRLKLHMNFTILRQTVS